MSDTCSVLLFGLWSSGKLLRSPKVTVADPLPKHLLFGWLCSPVQWYHVLAADQRVQSTIAPWCAMCWCVFDDSKKKKRIREQKCLKNLMTRKRWLGLCRSLTCCSPPPLNHNVQKHTSQNTNATTLDLWKGNKTAVWTTPSWLTLYLLKPWDDPLPFKTLGY